MRLLPSFLATALLLTSCRVKVTPTVTSGGHQFVADGITYIVPWEDGSEDDFAGFQYKGESVTAATKAGTLTVDGKSYGMLKTGDTVDLTNKGTVLVNGSARPPQ